MPTKEAAATKVLVEVAARAEGRCNPAPSFTAGTSLVGPSAWAVARDDYSIRTVPGKSLSVVSMAEWPIDTVSYRHKTPELKHRRRAGTVSHQKDGTELRTGHRCQAIAHQGGLPVAQKESSTLPCGSGVDRRAQIWRDLQKDVVCVGLADGHAQPLA